MTGDSQSPPPEGLIGSLRRFGRGVLHVVQTRLEILSTEIAEERFNLAKLALVAFGVLVLLQTGLLFALLFVVLAVGGEHRLMAIGISALVLLLGALAGGIWLRGWLKSRPPMFATTIAELRKDGDRLRGKP
jgi:uncharacterized membrane protein YqjE